jgi:tripartite-type tricarboxylate transporter receptor subunit TctC
MFMRLSQQTGLTLGALVVLAAFAAQAQTKQVQTGYPDRPIRIIVPLAPGGGSDYTARYIGLRLADRVGQAVVVDNRPAASGIVGTEMVAKAVPDGYTLLLAYSTHAQSAQLFSKLPYDPVKDFAPVTEVIATPLTLILNPTIPAKTVKEFIAYAKANPGKLNYGSSGPGSSPHLATELFASMAGFQATHIHTRASASTSPRRSATKSSSRSRTCSRPCRTGNPAGST